MNQRRSQVALLAVVIGVGATVAWTLRRPAPDSPATPALPKTEIPGERSEGVQVRMLKGDKESWSLTAKTRIGEEQGEQRFGDVVFTLLFKKQGQEEKAIIAAESCDFSHEPLKAVFRGGVHVTASGFELTTDTLTYRGDKMLARTEDPVQFRRKDISGTSRGMVYHADTGTLEMTADAYLRIDDEVQGPTEIRAARAVVDKTEGVFRFQDDVTLTQGANHLRSGKLFVYFSTGDASRAGQTLTRLVAGDDFVLRTAGDRTISGSLNAQRRTGPRLLKAKRLEIALRSDRTVEEMTAGPEGADLVIDPGPGESRERRILQAQSLVFRFDAQGHAREVEGQKGSSLTVERLPEPGKKVAAGSEEVLRCQRLLVNLDPQSGQITWGHFVRNVVFTRGRQRASAQEAWYDKSMLILKERPELIDEENGSRLQAEAIDVGTGERQGDIVARHSVQHAIRRPAQQGKGFLQGSEIHVSSRFFEYDEKSKTARYRLQAILLSGRDEVRAQHPEHGVIEIQEVDGRWRLTATGDVVTKWMPEEEAKGKRETTEARADSMEYTEERREVVYTGNVEIRQGEVWTRTPQKAVLLLGEDGRARTLTAGEGKVEVKMGGRKASGNRLTYTLADGKIVLVGGPVVYSDSAGAVQCLSLTLHVSDDRIQMDGLDVQRTQMIIKREPRKP